MLNLFLIDPNTALIENMVAIKLQQLFGSDFYYYQNGVEVDFYIPEKHLAIQVSYDLKDELTRKRDVNALLKMKNQFDDIDLMIITKDDENTIEINNTVIEVVPVWKWLLNW